MSEMKAIKEEKTVSNGINEKEVKKTVKRAMKTIVSKNYGGKFADELLTLMQNATGTANSEDMPIEECRFVKSKLSKQECEKVRKLLMKEINQRLETEEKLIVIARLTEALSVLMADGQKMKLPNNKRVQACYEIVETLLCNYGAAGLKHTFKIIESLEK